jgi:riboflavin transporter
MSNTKTKTNPTLAGGGRWSTRQLTLMALFVALGVVLGLFQVPILPMVSFLQLDLAAVPALIAGLAFGPAVGCVVGALTYIIQGLMVGEFGGEIINILIVCTMVCASASIMGYHRLAARADAPARTTGTTVLRIIATYAVCIVAVTLLGFIWNLTYTCWLYGMTQQAVLENFMLWIVIFNIIKSSVYVTVSLLVFRVVRPLLVNEKGKKGTQSAAH